jgi:hypothetical protein
VYALTAGFLARALVEQLMSSRRDALRRRSRAGQRGRRSQTLLRARHAKRLEAEEPARRGQALLVRYAKMVGACSPGALELQGVGVGVGRGFGRVTS